MPRPSDIVPGFSTGNSNIFAQRLFTGISKSYDPWAYVLSFGQYLRWRRSLASLLEPGDGKLVLDVSTGRAGIAMELARRDKGHVVGLDLTRPMLLAGRQVVSEGGLAGVIQLVQGRAESLPFPGGVFDAVVFSFLLRYVSDPQAALGEMSRVLKQGGQLLSLEFGVPGNPFWYAMWKAHTRVLMPAVTALVSPGWRRVGGFLGPSISGYYNRYPLSVQTSIWETCGMRDVQVRRLSLGGGIIMRGWKV